MVNKKIISICLGILFSIVLIFYLGFYGISFNNISGNAILDLNANYLEGEFIEGVLKLSLKEGELIPASSKILFTTSEQVHEYNLADFVTNDLIEGNFYIEGQSISGSGSGYGVIGEKIIYPKVDFTLNVYSPTSPKNLNQPEEIIEEKTLQTQDIESDVEVKEIIEEVEEQVEVLSEENIIEQPETEIIQTNEENKEILSEGDEKSEEVQEEIESQENQESVESKSEVEEILDTIPEQETTSITGGVIQNFLKIVSNFFLGITPTGQVSSEFAKEINGEVSQDTPFVYALEQGEIVEIVSSSQDVELNIQENEIIITTDYSEIEQGFGKDYLNKDTTEIIINLSHFDLISEKGELGVSLIYEDKEIVSLISTSEEEIITEIIKEEIVNVLSEKDKEILFEKFKNSTIKITKAESNGDRIIIRFELEEYWFEPSYSSEEYMYAQIEEDKIRWLQDIANTLSQDEIISQEIEMTEKEIKIF